MSKTKEAFIGVIVVAVVGYAAYVYRDELMFWKNKENLTDYQADFETKQQQDLNSANLQEQQQSGNKNPAGEEAQTPESVDNGELEGYLKDCDSRCVKRTGEDYKYCLEICGLPSSQSTASEGDCEKKTGREKDACLKSKAIKEKNDQYCDKISDKLLKESCINAVAEGILE